MSGAKHTPGPWVWQHWPDGQNTVATQATLGTVANVWTSGAGVDIDKANARLIAAAPELLEALQVAAERLGVRGHAMGAREARAAVAKAIGSTE